MFFVSILFALLICNHSLKGTYRAKLTADITSDAEGAVDGGFAILHGDSRAADSHAALAAYTGIPVYI
jgi:hypothetical protein